MRCIGCVWPPNVCTWPIVLQNYFEPRSEEWYSKISLNREF